MFVSVCAHVCMLVCWCFFNVCIFVCMDVCVPFCTYACMDVGMCVYIFSWMYFSTYSRAWGVGEVLPIQRVVDVLNGRNPILGLRAVFRHEIGL